MTARRIFVATVSALTLMTAVPANAATEISFQFFGDWAAHSPIAAIFTGGAFDAILAAAGITPNPSGSSSLTLVDYVFNSTDYIASWTAVLNVRAEEVAGGVLYSLLDTTLSQVGMPQNGAWYSYEQANAVPTNFVAVPGPVAAAGLPGVLALIGYGLYRRRRAA